MAEIGCAYTDMGEYDEAEDMDISSVTDRTNWTITRASSNNIAKTYNYGDDIPSTEIGLDYTPDYVIYDDDTCKATIGFTVRQTKPPMEPLIPRTLSSPSMARMSTAFP